MIFDFILLLILFSESRISSWITGFVNEKILNQAFISIAILVIFENVTYICPAVPNLSKNSIL